MPPRGRPRSIPGRRGLPDLGWAGPRACPCRRPCRSCRSEPWLRRAGSWPSNAEVSPVTPRAGLAALLDGQGCRSPGPQTIVARPSGPFLLRPNQQQPLLPYHHRSCACTDQSLGPLHVDRAVVVSFSGISALAVDVDLCDQLSSITPGTFWTRTWYLFLLKNKVEDLPKSLSFHQHRASAISGSACAWRRRFRSRGVSRGSSPRRGPHAPRGPNPSKSTKKPRSWTEMATSPTTK